MEPSSSVAGRSPSQRLSTWTSRVSKENVREEGLVSSSASWNPGRAWTSIQINGQTGPDRSGTLTVDVHLHRRPDGDQAPQL
jgi:hypothetical protein